MPLVTEDISITFHDSVMEDVLAEGRVISDGSTLVTVRVDVYPADEVGEERTLVALGTAIVRVVE